MPSRDLKVSIDGDAKGFDAACTEAEAKARGLDRELAKLERQQAAQEKVTARTTAAVRQFAASEDRAGLAARKMGFEVEQAAQKAQKAQIRADAAAKAYEKGLISEAAAARAAAAAETALERASIKAAEAQLAGAAAARKAADEERKLARDAELAGAAQKLAALKASGAVREHNAEVLRLRKEMPDLGKDGSKAFTLMGSASRSFGGALDGATSSMSELSGVGRAVPSLIAVGLQALPFLATAAGGAITLGLGGALSYIGLKAQASSADVQKSFSDLRTHATSEITKISAPFHETLLRISKDAGGAFDSMVPSLSGAFAKMAPAISGFSDDFSSSLRELNPAIDSIGTAFSRVLNTVGPQMDPIMHNLSTGVQAITDSVAKNPQALADMANGLSMVARVGGDTVGMLIKYEHQINAVSRSANAFVFGPLGWMALGAYKVKKAVDGSSNSLKIGEGNFRSFGEQAASGGVKLSALDKDMQTLASTTATATQKANALSDAFARLLNPAEAVFTDTAKLKDGIGQLSKALDKSHGSLSDNTAAGRATKQAFTGVLDSSKALASDMLNSHKSIDQVRASLNPYIHTMYEAAGSNKEARALVDAFVQSLGMVPPKKGTTLTLNDTEFLAKLHAAQGLTIDPKTGLLKGNNAGYFNSWLKANGLKLNPKTGLFKGNNADIYNKWLAANHLKIDPKTGQIKGNTKAFWDSIHGIPPVVGHRTISVGYVPAASANEPGKTKASGGPIGYAHGGSVARMADGGPSGPVVGPGSGTSDDIAVRLSNGEYVIRASQAKKHRALLDAVNGGENGFASGGAVGYASGGSVTPLALSDVLQHWQDVRSPATKTDVSNAVKARRTQVDQLKNAEDALYRARKAHDPRAVAAAERRIRKEREDLAAATAKLHAVEARYQYGKLSPAAQLDAALALGIKDNAAFIRNLQTLADRGAGDLANKLLAMGGPQAEKIAASAVKLNTSKLGSLQSKVAQEQSQQNYLADLPNILTVRSALKNTKGGISSWVALLNATGLDAGSLSAAVKLMTADLNKTSSGKALLADMHAHGYARGGPVTGPSGTDQVPAWLTSGEYVMTRQATDAHRPLLDALNYSTARVPVPAAPVLSGASGGAAGPAQVTQHNTFHAADPHVVARESARELAWMMRG